MRQEQQNKILEELEAYRNAFGEIMVATGANDINEIIEKFMV